MNIDKRFIILGLFILLFIIYYNKYITKNKKKFIGGEEVINCTLEEVLKHNLQDNKWVYINGAIYDFTYIINDDLDASLPTLFKNIDPTNIRTLITLIKYSNLQDLYKVFKSVESFNNYVNIYNADTNNITKLEVFKTENLDPTQNTNTQINERFNKFKLVFLISIKQFQKGVICPAGLTI